MNYAQGSGLMKCWEIKECCFEGTDPTESKCPPYVLQISCWEYDWVSFYRAMPDCEEKMEWRDVMLSDCPNCPVYTLHEGHLSEILEGLESA